MAWDVVSQPVGAIIPSSRMNQLYDNFAAAAAQNSGAPTWSFPNSALVANAGILTSGVASLSALKTVLGFGVNSYATYSFTNVEKILLTASASVMGNRVALFAGADLHELTASAYQTCRIRVGSLGGTVLATHILHTLLAGDKRHLVALTGFHVPASGPMSWILTGMTSQAEEVSIYDIKLLAIETAQQ